jgi:hypothetical protein
LGTAIDGAHKAVGIYKRDFATDKVLVFQLRRLRYPLFTDDNDGADQQAAERAMLFQFDGS